MSYDNLRRIHTRGHTAMASFNARSRRSRRIRTPIDRDAETIPLTDPSHPRNQRQVSVGIDNADELHADLEAPIVASQPPATDNDADIVSQPAATGNDAGPPSLDHLLEFFAASSARTQASTQPANILPAEST